MIEAKIIADTISGKGCRITTFQLRYPRFIHSEFMTHRMFSRNASSSRAIPVTKEVERVLNNPVLPTYIEANKKGMQGGRELDLDQWDDVRSDLMNLGIEVAEEIQRVSDQYNVHKQVLNRYLEPWLPIDVVVTATEWDNFFHLRCHEDAEPHIRELAWRMKYAMENNEPVNDAFHLPYITEEEDKADYPLYNLLAASAARCARVSYRNHDGSRCDMSKDISLANKLASSEHMSPFEHQAIMSYNKNFHYNLRGWKSYRYMMDANPSLQKLPEMVLS